MNAKERFYSGLAKETIGKITSNTDNWTSFLRTMSRNYEFTYPEQVKRDHPIDIVPEWVNLDRTEEGHTMNSYFVAHPEMVLGDTVEESTAYGMDITVRPIEGMELSELLKEAVSHIQGTYQAVELPEADKGKEIETIPATPDVKNFSYTVVDGNVYFRENSLMRRVDLNEKAKDRVMGMVELRGIVNELIEYQLEDYPDE